MTPFAGEGATNWYWPLPSVREGLFLCRPNEKMSILQAGERIAGVGLLDARFLGVAATQRFNTTQR